MPASTASSSAPSPRPGSTAAPAARPAPPSARTCASTPPRRPPSRPASGPACAAGPTPRRARRSGTSGPTSSARAMRLIRDGVVDREGVEGLAGRLGYSTRQLNRLLTAEVGHRAARPGPGPAQPDGARPARDHRPPRRPRGLRRRLLQRAPVQRHGARDVRRHAERAAGPGGAHGAGPPRQAGAGHPGHPAPPPLPAALRPRVGARLPRRCAPCPASRQLDGASYHAQPAAPPRARHRHAARAGGRGRRRARPTWRASCVLSDLRDLHTAVARCRQLLDLDADPVAIWEALRDDPLVGALVRRDPGRRVPGAADGFELAVRAVIGQQVSVTGARTVAGRLVLAAGELLPAPVGAVTHLFPTPAALVELAERDPGAFAMPAGRRRALVALAQAVDGGRRRDRPRRRPGRAPRARSWRCRASDRGRRSTSPCVRCAIPMPSCRPTSASGGPRWRSACPTTRCTCAPAHRTLATLAQLRHGPPVGAARRRHTATPHPTYERTCRMTTTTTLHRHHAAGHPDRTDRPGGRRRRADRPPAPERRRASDAGTRRRPS